MHEIFRRLRQDALPTVGAPAFQEDEALRIRRAMYGYRRRAAHPLTALDNPGVDIAFACFTRALVPERCGAHVPTHSQLVFRARGRATAQGGSRLRDPRIHRALRGRRRGQACRIGIAARTARAVAKTLRVLERRPGANRDAHEREFNPEASSKSADRSTAWSGLRPTTALNSEGERFRLDRNTGRRRLSAIAGEVLAGVSAARATFGRKQAKDLRNPVAPAAKSRMRRAADRLRDSFSSSPYLQAGWLVTAQKSSDL